jgi:hypothetical protein
MALICYIAISSLIYVCSGPYKLELAKSFLDAEMNHYNSDIELEALYNEPILIGPTDPRWKAAFDSRNK